MVSARMRYIDVAPVGVWSFIIIITGGAGGEGEER